MEKISVIVLCIMTFMLLILVSIEFIDTIKGKIIKHKIKKFLDGETDRIIEEIENELKKEKNNE